MLCPYVGALCPYVGMLCPSVGTPCPYVFPFRCILFWHGLWYHEPTVKGGGSMVLRATLVVLCIVLGLALFSSGEEYSWIWSAAAGLVVACVVLGIEYTLRKVKPGAVLGGAAGLACGLLLAGLSAWALETTIPAFEVVPVLGLLLLAIFPYLGLIYGVQIFTAA